MRTVVLYIEVQGKKFGSDDEGKHKQETDDGNANVPRHGLICVAPMHEREQDR